MKVLVIGSGSREHAFCWQLKRSSLVKALFCAPGNPGIGEIATNIAIKVEDIETLCSFAKKEGIDLTVVGPELPLSLGIVDLFRSEGLNIFGPTREAAQLESSKSFAKEIMSAANVPTAAYDTFNDEVSAREYCDRKGVPLVLKADGLAAGKGVCVCTESNQLEAGLKFIFSDLKADQVVIEEFLEGVEASYIVAVSESDIIPMASSHDYKRLLDGQRGPNTGGMGSVSPTPNLTPAQEAWTLEHIIKPTLSELKRRNIPFTGFLYGGLMISPSGKISVVEFNARMGDPECQSIMRRFGGDFAQLLNNLAANVKVEPASHEPLAPAAVTVVITAAGYPSDVRKGDQIFGLEHALQLPDILIFHGGTALNSDNKLTTAGGRVLSVTATGADVAEARQKAYRACDMIQFAGVHMRRDIGL